MISKVARFLNTVRWLKVQQIVFRVFVRFAPKMRPKVSGHRLRRAIHQWEESAERAPSMLGERTFRFLNQTGDIDESGEWDPSDQNRLWRYNLHYFEDLVAEGSSGRRSWHASHIGRWIDENPFPKGSGWEPYPCSLRITNWIKWSLKGNELKEDWLYSLATQAEWLSRNIEWHLLGNHLFENAKALFFAGLFFDTPESDRWLKKATDILNNEMKEQILEDGAHFELAPMYHCIILEDVLDMLNVCRVYGVSETESFERIFEFTAQKMLFWLGCMCHPDKRISLFNDSAFGISPEPESIVSYAARLGLQHIEPESGIHRMVSSGYVRAENKDAVLIADVGEIGPDYLPGHAHADSLGFELSLFGRRLLVDTGCSTYESSDERLRQRGTAAHNTVVINEQDSSQVWDSFRVAMRARPTNVGTNESRDELTIRGSHTGYQRLSGRVTHTRSWRLIADSLNVIDTIDGEFDSAEANFLFPGDIVVQGRNGKIELLVGSRNAFLAFRGGDFSIYASTWHPEFGKSLPATRINVRFTSHELESCLSW